MHTKKDDSTPDVTPSEAIRMGDGWIPHQLKYGMAIY